MSRDVTKPELSRFTEGLGPSKVFDASKQLSRIYLSSPVWIVCASTGLGLDISGLWG